MMPKLRTVADFETLHRLETVLLDVPYRRQLTYEGGGEAGRVAIIAEQGYENLRDLKTRIKRAGFSVTVKLVKTRG